MSTSHIEILYNIVENFYHCMSIMTFLRLKELREEFKVTQKQLSDYLHIKQNTYSQYENNQRQLPLDALVKLANFYDVSTDYILGLTDVETPYPKSVFLQK